MSAARGGIGAGAALLAVAPAAALASDALTAAVAVAVAAVAAALLGSWRRDQPATAWLAVVALGTLTQSALDAVAPGLAARQEVPLLATAVAALCARLGGDPARPTADTVRLAAALAPLLAARELAAPGWLPAGLAGVLPSALFLHAGGVVLVAGLLAVALTRDARP